MREITNKELVYHVYMEEEILHLNLSDLVLIRGREQNTFYSMICILNKNISLLTCEHEFNFFILRLHNVM